MARKPPQPKLSKEHSELLERAEELGVSTFGYTGPGARLSRLRTNIEEAERRLDHEEISQEKFDALILEANELDIDTDTYVPNGRSMMSLRAAIARETGRRALNAATKAGRESDLLDDEEEISEIGAFDELMGKTRGVIVRVAQWTEWLPTTRSEHQGKIPIANGITGFEAGENEKVVSINQTTTGQVKSVEDEDGMKVYTLYSFQAVLAQNVSTTLAAQLIKSQGGDEDGNLFVPSQRGIDIASSVPTPPNRAQRRKR